MFALLLYTKPSQKNRELTMFIAQQKKRDNIAEYLLYMWQLEDILRAYQLNMDSIQEALIAPSSLSDSQKNEAYQWYNELIGQMRAEGIEKEGHLKKNKLLLKELGEFHKQLLKSGNETKYVEVYYKTLPYIQELRSKTKDQEVHEIEICFTALYGYLLLKLQKKSISPETATAITQISDLLRHLAERYHQQQSNKRS